MDQTTYRLNEAKAQSRLQEFRADDGAPSLRDEIALCRLLIEQASNQGGLTPLLRDLLNTQAGLVKAARLEEVRRGELFSKERAHRLAREWSEIIADEMERYGMPGWEDVVERIADRINGTITEITGEATV